MSLTLSARAATCPSALPAVQFCPPSDPVGKALFALCNVQECVKVTADGHLALSAQHGARPLEWPCVTSHVLYVRSCYAPIYKGPLDHCRRKGDAPVDRHIVAGPPGIGKSAFGCVPGGVRRGSDAQLMHARNRPRWYLLYRILSEDPQRTVIYSANNTPVAFMVHGGRVFRSTQYITLVTWAAEHGLDSVLLVDSFSPTEANMPTIVIGRTGVIEMSEMSNLQCAMRAHWFMPYPTHDEVLGMRRVAFSHLPEEECIWRMGVWGPNPRLVLALPLPDMRSVAWNDVPSRIPGQCEWILRETVTEAGESAGDPTVQERALAGCSFATLHLLLGKKYRTAGPRVFAVDPSMR